jgi:hypothetical protein
VSEEWRKIEEFRRPVANLRLTVSADAEIEIRSRERIVHASHVSADQTLALTHVFDSPLSIWLKNRDPNCICMIHADYIEETTTLPLALDMRYLYGPMGLGIPMAGGLPLDVSSFYVNRSPYADIGGPLRPEPDTTHTIGKETAKQDKPQTPVPGITRLQAFKRELDETPKKKQKRNILSRLKKKAR